MEDQKRSIILTKLLYHITVLSNQIEAYEADGNYPPFKTD